MTSFFSFPSPYLSFSLVTRFPNADFHFLSSSSLICVFTLTPSLFLSFLPLVFSFLSFPHFNFLSDSLYFSQTFILFLTNFSSLSLLLTFLSFSHSNRKEVRDGEEYWIYNGKYWSKREDGSFRQMQFDDLWPTDS